MSEYYSFMLRDIGGSDLHAVKLSRRKIRIENGTVTTLEKSGLFWGKWEEKYSWTITQSMEVLYIDRMGLNNLSGSVELQDKSTGESYREYIYDELDAFISELNLPVSCEI
ncbi:hypothetical protein CKO50_11785 [Pseudoalteromonas sp. HM-SA03]|uniref:hypothetical protein n=1 Tax=unclassified Pseudoalteromonas TaxID=194690 RepID=UPI000BAE44C8|nr:MULTISPECIES: hypothetical protein [unclassified Pseudoalteromonas]MCG7555725.1 hypothetical protein [Pseudoalteromonas sp. Of11M-6]PAY01181.1 hypothetical protein CKO50_11785 [Pseudoalteromonas sp. HM-SA03]